MKGQYGKGGLFLLCTAMACPPLAADTPVFELDKIVVSATGFEQKLTEAPASISVITEEDLKTRPFTTLLDAVKYQEGVDLGTTRDKTGQGSISMRGLTGEYTLVLIDGKRQNNHGDIYPNNFGGNQFNHVAPMESIERIEVIRGPASTLYGADAMGGVINIITKKHTDEWTGAISFGRTFQTDDSFGDDITTDFTTTYTDLNGDGEFDYTTGPGADSEVVFTDDYNVKDKARSFWVGVNVSF